MSYFSFCSSSPPFFEGLSYFPHHELQPSCLFSSRLGVVLVREPQKVFPTALKDEIAAPEPVQRVEVLAMTKNGERSPHSTN